MVLNPFYGGDPFREMRRLQDEVNRLFQTAAAPRSGGFPAINVYAHQDGIVINAVQSVVGAYLSAAQIEDVASAVLSALGREP